MTQTANNDQHTMSPALESASSVNATAQKEVELISRLAALGSAVVAFSGGVDSSYLADLAAAALGERALIITAQSPSMADSEFAFATTLATERGWNFQVVQTGEANDPKWLANNSNRCYFCKTELFAVLNRVAADKGISHVLYGAIPEDLGDVRPGLRAATEANALAPLIDVALTKPEIRMLSQRRQLPSWDKPQAACLASRFPTGTAITHATLRQVDRAEASLQALGFLGHRVRHHGDLARIELQAGDWGLISSERTRARMVALVKDAGYRHVTIDLGGYVPAGQNS